MNKLSTQHARLKYFRLFIMHLKSMSAFFLLKVETFSLKMETLWRHFSCLYKLVGFGID